LKEYVKVQIIKHALARYIKRPEATEKEVEQEKRLLDAYKERVDYLKQKYSIK